MWTATYLIHQCNLDASVETHQLNKSLGRQEFLVCKLLFVNVLESFKMPTKLSASDLKIVLNQFQSDSTQLFLKRDPEADFRNVGQQRSLEVIQTSFTFNGSSNAFLLVGILTENVPVHLTHVVQVYFHKCTDTYNAKVLRDWCCTNQDSISYSLTRREYLLGIFLKTHQKSVHHLLKDLVIFFLHASFHRSSQLPNTCFCKTPQRATMQHHENSAPQSNSAVINHFVNHYIL